MAAVGLLFAHKLPGGPPASSVGSNKWSNLHIRLDIMGTALSVPGLILLVYGLTTGNHGGWDKPDIITTLVLAVLLLGSFVFVEVRVSSDPILPKYVWGDRVRILGCVVAALTYAVWQGCNYLLILQLQGKIYL